MQRDTETDAYRHGDRHVEVWRQRDIEIERDIQRETHRDIKLNFLTIFILAGKAHGY